MCLQKNPMLKPCRLTLGMDARKQMVSYTLPLARQRLYTYCTMCLKTLALYFFLPPLPSCFCLTGDVDPPTMLPQSRLSSQNEALTQTPQHGLLLEASTASPSVLRKQSAKDHSDSTDPTIHLSKTTVDSPASHTSAFKRPQSDVFRPPAKQPRPEVMSPEPRDAPVSLVRHDAMPQWGDRDEFRVSFFPLSLSLSV